MDVRKSIKIGFIIFLLLVGVTFDNYTWTTHLIKPSLLRDENIDELSLTIYYNNPAYCTLFPFRIDDLINYGEGKIVIIGSELEGQIDLFKRMSNSDLVPVRIESPIDASVYYVLES